MKRMMGFALFCFSMGMLVMPFFSFYISFKVPAAVGTLNEM